MKAVAKQQQLVDSLGFGKILLALFQRDLKLAFRAKSEILNPPVFFLMTVSLFPLAVSPQAATLQLIAPGVIWVCALLACLLTGDALFRTDFEDGSLDMLLVSPVPLSLLVEAKVLVHWLVSGIPLVLVSPLLALMMHLPAEAIPVLLLSLLLGTFCLSHLAAIGAALTVGLKRGDLLLSLLVLPFLVPVLIFGSSAVVATSQGLPANGQLLILMAFFALSFTLAPFAIAAALRISADQ